MSEYQYYEFLALDRPLTRAQREELRSISSRAEITANKFISEYQWGDLQGDPREIVTTLMVPLLCMTSTFAVGYDIPGVGLLSGKLPALRWHDRDVGRQ
jgi:hypothetical protein